MAVAARQIAGAAVVVGPQHTTLACRHHTTSSKAACASIPTVSQRLQSTACMGTSCARHTHIDMTAVLSSAVAEQAGCRCCNGTTSCKGCCCKASPQHNGTNTHTQSSTHQPCLAAYLWQHCPDKSPEPQSQGDLAMRRACRSGLASVRSYALGTAQAGTHSNRSVTPSEPQQTTCHIILYACSVSGCTLSRLCKQLHSEQDSASNSSHLYCSGCSWQKTTLSVLRGSWSAMMALVRRRVTCLTTSTSCRRRFSACRATTTAARNVDTQTQTVPVLKRHHAGDLTAAGMPQPVALHCRGSVQHKTQAPYTCICR